MTRTMMTRTMMTMLTTQRMLMMHTALEETASKVFGTLLQSGYAQSRSL